MFGLGIWELLIILFIILLVVGGGKLPALGRQLGKAVNEVRSISAPEKKDENEEGQTAQAQNTTEDLVSGLKELNQLRTSSGKIRLLKRLSKKL